MKIAYLILAHSNYIHLQRLINSLQYNGVTFYIHIDRKSRVPTLKGNNIIYVKRIRVYWSTFREVEATIILLKRAIKDNNDRYILLSGMDYPVQSNEALIKRLSTGKEFVWFKPHTEHAHPISFFKYYYFNFFERKSYGLKTKLFRWIEKILRKKFYLRKQIPFEFYVGSQWFALTKDCVEYILQTIKEDRKYIKFFKTCRFPCESFFVTIIAHSKFKNNTGHLLTYIDWSNKSTPELITQKHFSFLREHREYFFARKFNDNSENILKLIDIELRNCSTEYKKEAP